MAIKKKTTVKKTTAKSPVNKQKPVKKSEKTAKKAEKTAKKAEISKKTPKKAEISKKTVKKAPKTEKKAPKVQAAKKAPVAKKAVSSVKKAVKTVKKVVKTVKKAPKTVIKVVKKPENAEKTAKKVSKVTAKAPKAPASSAKPVSSKSAMDSFKKTLTAVHKRGMTKISQSDRKMLKQELQNLHDRVMSEIEFLTDDSLNRSMKDTAGDMTMHGMHMADHGTDNFDREFALNLVSAEHDVLYEINDALRRIDGGTYGVCEDCGCQIEKARLEALPFARFCIRCKSAKEKGSVKYRPLGPTLSSHF